ncbi:MAG: L-serine ammonia-lyase, iron-sulfur-dependent, subunit alpha [Lachnospiraceae bacterium]|nr:L-serine ammonia-lyase, iron-sulfur-dependent, subunit alpha [Lachnospiraceae bacterium]
MNEKIFYPDFFNDVFGPIMQPGSSSSFAGTSRVGRIARYTLKSEPSFVRITFNPSDDHMKSLGNMMDDRAYLGGLQDFATDDIRLYSSHELARKAGISYEFSENETDNAYPGSTTFALKGTAGDEASLIAASIGGGMVKTYEINGFPLTWQADTYAVLVFGAPEDVSTLEGTIRKRLGEPFVRQSAKKADGSVAVLLEYSEAPDLNGNGFTPEQAEIRVLPALLPVVSRADRKAQLFTTVEEWRNVAKERGISFVEAAIEYEKGFSGWSREEIWAYFEKINDILHAQVHSLETVGYENAADTPNLPIYGKDWNRYLTLGGGVTDALTQNIITRAMSTNAKLPGTLIVPGPMGTGGGYLYSALDAVREARGSSKEKVIESLIVAAGLGVIAFTHAQATGSSGCVGESGVCCAMASGAVTHLAGGDGTMVEHAASMALQANLGIPCDPIPGGKEFPCITRTIRAAVTAPLYADLALSGIDPLIPYHEVLFAIEEHRKHSTRTQLHEGINASPCAKCIQQCFAKEQMGDRLSWHADSTRK